MKKSALICMQERLTRTHTNARLLRDVDRDTHNYKPVGKLSTGGCNRHSIGLFMEGQKTMLAVLIPRQTLRMLAKASQPYVQAAVGAGVGPRMMFC